MKYFLLLLLVINLNGYSQDEKLIYNEITEKLVLKDYYGSKKPDSVTLLIFRSREFNIISKDYKYLKENFARLKYITFENFNSVSNHTILKENFEKPKVGFIFLENDSLSENQLIEKYPLWNFKKIKFSNIGFDESKKQALVYYEFVSNSLNGGGAYIILCKKSKKWKIKKIISSWST